MEKQEIQSRGNLFPALLLIIIGLALFLGQFENIGSDKTWPLFILAPGIGFWALFFSAKNRQKQAGLLIPAIITTGLALFFIYLNCTDWSQMQYLWPLFPLIVGIAFYATYFADKKSKGLLVPATILLVVAIFFLIFARTSYSLWPLLMVAGGIIILFSGPQKTKNGEAEEEKEEK
jgi:cytochrome bd-type quinol oxidase subunit 2